MHEQTFKVLVLRALYMILHAMAKRREERDLVEAWRRDCRVSGGADPATWTQLPG